jgi:RHS repeat-associated protein
MAAKAGTVLLSLAAFCLPAFANIPRTTLVAEKPHQGVEGFVLVSHQGPATANALIAPGLRGCLCDEGRRSRSTGKERDAETGLDYFGARYMSSAQGRFTSPDKPFADQHPEDPQSWNLYAYVRNSPLAHVDTDGQACFALNSSSAFCGRATEYGQIEARASGQTRFFAAAAAVSQALANCGYRKLRNRQYGFKDAVQLGLATVKLAQPQARSGDLWNQSVREFRE